jgi:predicted transcriptional regulator
MGARRSAIEIVYEMLDAWSRGDINKTAIMYRCRSSYDQLRRYLTRLCDQGLLRAAGVHSRYQITPQVRETLLQASTVIHTLTSSDD